MSILRAGSKQGSRISMQPGFVNVCKLLRSPTLQAIVNSEYRFLPCSSFAVGGIH